MVSSGNTGPNGVIVVLRVELDRLYALENAYTPGNEVNECEGYTGSDQLEVLDCTLEECISGDDMVLDESDKAGQRKS